MISATFRLPSTVYVLAATCLLALALPATAQTAPSLLLKPWSKDANRIETFDQPLLIGGGHTSDDVSDTNIFYYRSHGRIKLDDAVDIPGFTFGYQAAVIDTGINHPAIPSGMTDISVAGGFELGQWEQWDLSMIAGVGMAADNHFRNSDAWYGIGTLNASRKLDEQSLLHVGLSYNGNRTFLPDVPLPYLMYQRRVSDTLAYSVGFPVSTLTWQPAEQVLVQVNYSIPIYLTGKVSYYLTKEWSIFAEYERDAHAFALSGNDSDRLFYEMERVTAGVTWSQSPNLSLTLGAGYAFDQEFSTGFDLRDTDNIVDLSDEPMLIFAVRGRF